MRRRRLAACGIAALVVATGAHIAAAAGGITIDPTSGAPGSSYTVSADCGPAPDIYAHNLQDSYVQATIGNRRDQLQEVAPSTWQLHVTAGQTDELYYGSCEGSSLGEARFDAESPHLWFGPRPPHGPDVGYERTTAEGTDCPDGTTAHVTITAGGKTTTSDATIDQYGDWSVNLPSPVGTEEMTVDASCGSVQYAAIKATTTTTTTTTSTPATQPTAATTPTAPPATGAQAQPASTSFTG
jgi:cell division septation protein DedD